ncbi:MAG: hypothetical protein Q8S26_12975 [Azonexus sp.]|nr:hypothetical protein [Azonexus sp.]
MPAPVNSSSSNLEVYRAQNTSATTSLKATEKMAKAMGFDTTGIQNAIQAVSGNRGQDSSSTKVSLSAEGTAKSQAEGATPPNSATSTSRAEKRQFKSVDEALAYGASRSAEQASSRQFKTTGNAGETDSVNTKNELAASSRPEKKQFSSVEEAISYGAQRAVEQYAKQQSTIRG